MNSMKYLWVAALLAGLLLAFRFFTRPRSRKGPNGITFSDVSILPNGIYGVLYRVEPRQVAIYHEDAPRREERIYIVNVDGVPTDAHGGLVEHFVKQGKRVS